MEVCIRRAKPGDEETLAMIQIKSWQSAFADILDRETLEGCTDFERVTATYRRLLEQGIGNGYLLTVDGKPHCIAWWDRSRTQQMAEYAELICIHSLPLTGCGRALQQDDGAGAVGHGSRRIPAGDAVGVCREHPRQKIL